MGGTPATPLKKPHQIVIERAKVYAYKGQYLQVYVFTTWLSELAMLVRAYGGHYYKHGTGYRWVLAKRGDLCRLVEKVNEHLPSVNRFEDPIIKYYMQNK